MGPQQATHYLGLASSFHDPAVALVDSAGCVLFAEATERRLQDKRAINSVPDGLNWIDSLLAEYIPDGGHIVACGSWLGSYRPRELRWMGLSHTSSLPMLKWLVPTHNALARSAGRNLTQRLGINAAKAGESRWTADVRRMDHHRCHATYAVLSSAFEKGACAVVDAAGQGTSMSFFTFEGNSIREIPRSRSTCSLGLFYALLCDWAGFDSYRGEEWKAMGLAARGTVDPALRSRMMDLFRVAGLRLEYGLKRADFRARLGELGVAARRDREINSGISATFAATGQAVFEDVLAEVLSNLRKVTGTTNLVAGGGCFLNSSFNGKLLSRTGFTHLHVPSAPADDGNALGAAWAGALDDRRALTSLERPLSPYLGSRMSNRSKARLQEYSGNIARSDAEPISAAARLIADGHIIGWVHGRAEFGPRALGNRSILADPRDPGMLDRINATVKFREEFRPLAPAVLAEQVSEYFDVEEIQASDFLYMERAIPVRADRARDVPAIVHVDGTARLQSVRRELNPEFHALISEFYRLTGVPMVVNTSLNVMGKPIVNSPEDALSVLLTSGIDALFIDGLLLASDDIHRKVAGYPAQPEACAGPVED